MDPPGLCFLLLLPQFGGVGTCGENWWAVVNRAIKCSLNRLIPSAYSYPSSRGASKDGGWDDGWMGRCGRWVIAITTYYSCAWAESLPSAHIHFPQPSPIPYPIHPSFPFRALLKYMHVGAARCCQLSHTRRRGIIGILLASRIRSTPREGLVGSRVPLRK
jgi:hypothetical protein